MGILNIFNTIGYVEGAFKYYAIINQDSSSKEVYILEGGLIPYLHWKAININCICLNLHQIMSKSYSLILEGGGHQKITLENRGVEECRPKKAQRTDAW